MTYTINHTELMKTAGTQTALETLGLTKSANLFGRLLVGGTVGAVKGLARLASGVASGLTKPIATPAGNLGMGMLNAAGRAGVPRNALLFARRLGKGLSKDIAGFGLLGGGINAAMAPEGERSTAFLKGFGSGALGGAVFGVGSNAARMGIGKVLGAQGARRFAQEASTPLFGPNNTWRNYRSKLLMSGVPLATGIGADMMLTPKINPFETKPVAPVEQAARDLPGAMASGFMQQNLPNLGYTSIPY